ncbi:hypothetical protein EAF00_011398 [Botryotinia globosa]|nr:hypothetical protein EAF00_011398 [Botryotinia globosa]
MQAIGGDAWQAGLNYVTLAGMAAAMGEGYVSLSTDAGQGTSDNATCGLLSAGNPNRNLQQNLASTSFNDLAIIGKDITKKHYGTPPVYSYWTGCSQSGCQGMMLAQKFREAFDEIAASTLAINWSGIFVGDLWTHVIMNTVNIYPHMCKMQANTAAALTACDANDDLVDGIIADPDSCDFDPTTLVGTTINCTEIGGNFTISSGAAYPTQAMWDGPRMSDNSTVLSNDDTSAGDHLLLPHVQQRIFYGTSTISSTPVDSEACSQRRQHRYLKYNAPEFDQFYHSSINEWSSTIDTNDPDLSQFRASGEKLLTYHGLADGITPPNSLTSYYDSVTALDPNVHDFYRMFMAPGISHFFGGLDACPADTFDNMHAWVESHLSFKQGYKMYYLPISAQANLRWCWKCYCE